MSETNNEIGESVRIDDSEGFVAEQHLQQLTESRGNVTEMRMKARQEHILGNLPREKSTALYATAVENYLLNLLPAFDADEETHEEYWEEAYLGSVHISPIDAIVDGMGTGSKYLVDDTKYDSIEPHEKVVDFEGLIDIINRPTLVSREFEAKKARHIGSNGTRQLRGEAVVSREILDTAVATADNFSQEIGLGLRPETNDKWEV